VLSKIDKETMVRVLQMGKACCTLDAIEAAAVSGGSPVGHE